MSFKDLVIINRSYRKFDATHTVDTTTLHSLVDLARLTPSSANRQPLKFIVSNTKQKNDTIFPHLAWAGYLTYWKGPEEHERPTAYIIILNDTTIHKGSSCDHGIAAQTVLLGAAEIGLGGCMIGAFQRKKIKQALNIPEQYEILLVIALGKPAEQIKIEKVKDGNIKYWRDKKGIHHVPKRELDDLILPL